MLLNANTKSEAGRRNIGTGKRLIKTAKGFANRVWKKLGEERIKELSKGQEPKTLVVYPPAGLVTLGIRSVIKLKTRPGEKFTVTCKEDGTFDEAARGSAFYGLEHLRIRNVVLYGVKGTLPQMKVEIEALRGEKDFLVETHAYSVVGTRVNSTVESINGGGTFDVGEAPRSPPKIEAVVIDCSDSRVMTYRIFEGHTIAVVSNAGNVLSPTALETIKTLVGQGVPAVILLGHSNCGAVGGCLSGNKEEQLAFIMGALKANIPISKRSSGETAEIANAISSTGLLLGKKHETDGTYNSAEVKAVSSLILEKKTVVIPAYHTLGDGNVGELSTLVKSE